MSPEPGRRNEQSRERGVIPIVAFVCAVSVLAGSPAPSSEPEPISIFFYDPDSLNNVEVMKAAMERFLVSHLPHASFQPFVDRSQMERHAREEAPSFAILAETEASRWRGHGRQVAPLLRSMREGETTYRKVVVTGQAQEPSSSLAHRTFAGTFGHLPREHIAEILLSPLGLEHGDVHLIPVPKDVDALLALAFGQVDVAFVSEATLATVRELEPELLARADVLYRSEPIENPGLYATRTDVPENVRRTMKQAFREISSHPDGRRAMELLGFDSWQPIAGDRDSGGGER